MLRTFSARLLQAIAALAIVAAIVVFFRKVLPVNQTTVALTLLIAILAVSSFWGFAVSAVMSVAAMLAFNYFFIPPVGTFTVADPQNWVALAAFLAASLLASQLSSRMPAEAKEAEARRQEVERLYTFSQQLLVSGNVINLLNALPNYIVETFGVGAAALYLDYKQKFYHSGAGGHLSEDEMRQAMAREEPFVDMGRSLSFAPVRMGPRAIGSLGISGRLLSRQTLEALGTLIGVEIGRATCRERV